MAVLRVLWSWPANISQQVGAELHVLHVVRMPMPAEGALVLIEVCRDQALARR